MSGSREGQQEFDLLSLPFAQLTTIRKQMEQEVEFLTTNYTALRMAHQKFVESRESLDAIQPGNDDKDVFVPMTSSMFVPGKLADVKSVVVDVGTGYFLEKSVDEAKEYFKRREKALNEQLSSLSKTINEKRKNLEALTEVMQAKLYDIQAQSKATRSKAVATASS